MKLIKKIASSHKNLSGWHITTEGLALAGASARTIKREVAERQVLEFFKRVDIVNAEQHFIYKVSTVCIFGSFLSTKPVIGDIDLAVELTPKISDQEVHGKLCAMKTEEAHMIGKKFSSFLDGMLWPHDEVWDYLKSGSRGLNLHSYPIHSEFLEKIENKVIFKQKNKE